MFVDWRKTPPQPLLRRGFAQSDEKFLEILYFNLNINIQTKILRVQKSPSLGGGWGGSCGFAQSDDYIYIYIFAGGWLVVYLFI